MKRVLLFIILLTTNVSFARDHHSYGHNYGYQHHDHYNNNQQYWDRKYYYPRNRVYIAPPPVQYIPLCNPYYNNCYQPFYPQPRIGISVPGFNFYFGD